MLESAMWFDDYAEDFHPDYMWVGGVHDGMDVACYIYEQFQDISEAVAEAVTCGMFTAILHGPATAQQWKDYWGDRPISHWGVGGGNRW